ncbi:AAA family ATPase [Burkholderia gladioli pv. gladioli]|uniref:AAA ATPase domain protein n=1 Tax=Burkholderia gladioli TaxID=28095 RepID=A0A095EZN3_BURGA|nr:AAA family ATPase [Burkholderia gladioli]AJW97213.1 AAA ATPase domain protein [Burkholderia gladioli]ASD79822.1 ATP-binding protein [Burkholderia gladioli pv. gladioli]AWY54931.1 ATP-binding protein [Burkholderia gladioli pv. gladioli]KGC10881.1 AAA ATPase domain protein [Burkholderia gladioli]MDJ1164070.1 AAA family ATPase [Burkholderia gladioli pv. gladioli]
MAEFLNRRRHLERLSEVLATASRESTRMVIATGKAGVGKSALFRQAASKVASKYCYLYCDRAPASGDLADGAPVPELIQRRLSAVAPEHGFATFADFRTNKQWSTSLLRATEAVGSIVARSMLPGLASKFAMETYGQVSSAVTSRLSERRWTGPGDDQRIVYAQSVLQSVPTIVHVDHAHLLEGAELDLLVHLLDDTQAILFLEYTEKAGDGDRALPVQFVGRRVLKFAVDPLGEEYADRLFATLPPRFARPLRTQFTQTGDLRPFDEAVYLQSRDRGILEIFDITEDNLVRTTATALSILDTDTKKVLLAISAHAGPVDRGVLSELLDEPMVASLFDGAVDIDLAIDQLDSQLLVIATENDVMCQTRVSDLVQRDALLSTIKTTFRKHWRDLYRTLPHRTVFASDEDRCRQLLHQCAELNDIVGIARTLEEIGYKGISSRNPRSMVTYLRHVIDKLKFGGEKDAIARIVRAQCCFFYEAGWFDEALACLLLTEDRPRRYQFLLAELYCSAGQAARGIRLAESHLAQLDPLNPDHFDAELCLRLVKLHGLRNSNRLVEAREYYLSFVDEQRFSGLPAFPTLLRYADLCMYKDGDIKRCNQYLQRAAALTKATNQWRDYASICISLVQQLGYTEALDEAEAFLSEAEEVGQRVWLQQPMLLANRAVLSMYRGHAERACLQLLQQALVLSYDQLDRILIQTNILIWYVMAGSVQQAMSVARVLYERIDDVSVDTEIRRIVLYNLEQLERNQGNEESANRLYDRWSALDSGIDEAYWAYRRARRSAPNTGSRRYRMVFHPIYLAHWHAGLVPFEAIGD